MVCWERRDVSFFLQGLFSGYFCFGCFLVCGFFCTFFSMIVIYVINLLIVTALLLATAPQASISNFFETCLANTEEFVSFVTLVLQQIGVLLRPLARKLHLE